MTNHGEWHEGRVWNGPCAGGWLAWNDDRFRIALPSERASSGESDEVLPPIVEVEYLWNESLHMWELREGDTEVWSRHMAKVWEAMDR